MTAGGKQLFDWYAFADYSGARSKREQRRHIVLAVNEGGSDGGDSLRLAGGITRTELMEEVLELLRRAERERKRVLFGFDHNYGFPEGFHQAVHGEAPEDWHEVLKGFVHSIWPDGLLKLEELEGWRPRDWAREVNERIALSLGREAGPFWGTLFVRRPEPGLFGTCRLADGTVYEFRERRLAEERLRRMKPAYQLGGIGSVGQQSLYGMLYLWELLQVCRAEGIKIHAWPMDGTDLPAAGHVLAEIYPTMCLGHLGLRDKPRSDAGDARACVLWAGSCDRDGSLAGYFNLAGLGDLELRRVRMEGWPLGLEA